jgi:hypothetical protein
MKALKAPTRDPIAPRIMTSLQYLAMEAKNGGCDDLYAIIHNALKIARTHEHPSDLSCRDLTDDDNAAKVLEFLMRFENASPKSRQQVLAIIETSQMDKD